MSVSAPPAVTCCCFTRDYASILCGFVDGTVSKLNWETGELERTFEGHTDKISCLEVHPKENTFVTCSIDKSLRLWNLENGMELHKFEARRGLTHCCFTKCSPFPTDNAGGALSILASSSEDRYLYFVPSPTFTPIRAMMHPQNVTRYDYWRGFLRIAGLFLWR